MPSILIPKAEFSPRISPQAIQATAFFYTYGNKTSNVVHYLRPFESYVHGKAGAAAFQL